MKVLRMGLAATGILAACSNLPTTGDGVVAIEVQVPSSLVLHLGDSIMLHARALNQQGDSVAADLRWYTPDTAAVSVDSIRGVVTARQASGSARIQAAVGNLRSDPLMLLLAPAPTTLVLPPTR
jgi:hypothetical protein